MSGAAVLLLGLLAVSVGIRLLEPSNSYDKDQPGVIGHVVDVAVHDHWLVQWEVGHGYATKPPLYPWIAGLGLKVRLWLGGSDALVHPLWFAWPSLVAAGLTAWVVYAIGKPRLGRHGGLLAAAIFVANPVTYRLMYVARTDALITLLLIVAAWATVRQFDRWNDQGPAGRSSLGWIALFWLATLATAMTKGPVALMAIVFLLGLIAYRGAWRRCRPGWQAVGLAVTVALPLAWLAAVLHFHPDYAQTLEGEMGSRVAGTADQPWQPYLAEVYALTRFLPWSPMALVAGLAVGWAAWVCRKPSGLAALASPRRREARRWRKLGPWAGFCLAILGVLMFASTQRPDRLMPLYPAASLLTAACLLEARRRWSPPRWASVVVLSVVAFAGIVGVPAVLASPWQGPGPLQPEGAFGLGADREAWWNLRLAAPLAIVGGLACLVGLAKRRWMVAAWAGCFAVIGLTAVESHYQSGPSQSRQGDQLIALARVAQDHRGDRPIVFHHTGYAPIQALFARNTPASDAELDRIGIEGGLVITANPDEVRARFPQRIRTLARTGELQQPGRPLVLVDVVDASR
ncbi:MAG: ArnT family glycosyltransferase [Phycisphaeraceae bacterium]